MNEIDFKMEGDEDTALELLDELGALLGAESMALVFDSEEKLIGVCMGPAPMISTIADDLDSLWDCEFIDKIGTDIEDMN